MFSLLISAAEAKRPIVLLPPFYGSQLFANSNNTGLPFYCKKTYKNENIWANAKMLVPPFLNCFLKTIKNNADENGIPRNKIELKPIDFGGNSSVLDIIKLPFGKSAYPMYTPLLKSCYKEGYTLKKDLFVAPYDFRNVPTFAGTFWNDLTKLIEDASQTNNQKVNIFGFSQGGFVTQQFLTMHTTKEWRKKYINSVVLLAPSFTGGSSIFYELWTKEFSLAPFLKLKGVSDFIESWPGFHIHIPNLAIYKNKTYVIGPDGAEYKAPQLVDIIKERKIIQGNNLKMFEHSLKIISKIPDEIDDEIPVTIFYNSGRNTSFTLNFKNGWEKKPEREYVRGDGTIAAEGLEYVCNTWKNIKCFDFKSGSEKMIHDEMIYNDFVHRQIHNRLSGKPIEKYSETKAYEYDEQ